MDDVFNLVMLISPKRDSETWMSYFIRIKRTGLLTSEEEFDFANSLSWRQDYA